MKILEQVFEEITITDNDTTGYSYELTLKNKTLADIASFFGEENLQEIRLSKPVKKTFVNP
jgi:hypothetical protein